MRVTTRSPSLRTKIKPHFNSLRNLALFPEFPAIGQVFEDSPRECSSSGKQICCHGRPRVPYKTAKSGHIPKPAFLRVQSPSRPWTWPWLPTPGTGKSEHLLPLPFEPTVP